MPIRMVEDDQNDQQQYDPNEDRQYQEREQQASGGGGLGSSLFLIPVIGWLFKRPKLLILAIVAALAYFFIIKPMMSEGGSSNSSRTKHDGPLPTTGATFDPKKYDSTEVFAPLDQTGTNVPLPDRVSLERFAPMRKNQGEQGSCVAWSAAYAARTIMEASSRGVDPNSIAFSPAYLYNQIHLPDCQGSLLPDAMKTMLYKGSVPLQYFPYNPNTCTNQPSNQAHTLAQQYRTRGFQRLTVSDADQRVDFNAIKQYLASGAPVVIGMMVPRSFMQGMYGEKVWQPEAGDNPNHGTMGGHAMCVIGYDDNLAGGSFQIMNSWGNEWGENGIGWVRYQDFMTFNKEAYGLYPLPNKDAALNRKFACAIGMVKEGKNFLPLKHMGNGYFETTQPIAKGTKFKMYVKNELECYTYIFGEETNGSSYILFPYTTKHSPFCGITGARLFPKDASLQVDNLGTKDFMAIVVSKQPINYVALNAKINSAKGGNYAAKVKAALGNMAIPNVNYGGDANSMAFSAVAPTDNKAVVCVVGINK
jgi:C1A family cysteine protease